VQCATAAKPASNGPVPAELMAELWSAPGNQRNLYYGSGGRQFVPPPGVYRLLEKESRGFSTTYDVTDPAGSEWAVKLGEEARVEVVVSRILWGLGYHAPPTHYVTKWTLESNGTGAAQSSARFRPKPAWLKQASTWHWQRNPFAGTRPLNGLLTILVMLNSTDLKEENNALYQLDSARDGARRWFVVKDVGASLGETGALFPKRGDIMAFERHGFIERVENGHVKFEFRGLHASLLNSITPADVRWAGDRMATLTDAQWRDAFRAGAFHPEIADRYIRRIREKIRAARALQ
jgi:hypothetical protein